ncbi:MAG: phage tail sheath family protein [Gemmatimonadales bacterium]|nr:MAG: phage tail sheath family protein [Gemmatimonadales bacterium]
MATVMKTPGVYIVEKNAFPNSVVEVATAVPAFIGYTEFARDGKKSILNKPRPITSMAEFHTHFGFGPEVVYTLSDDEPSEEDSPPVPLGPSDPAVSGDDGRSYYLSRVSGRYHLYYSMLLFFQNGGGRCYVTSVGSYEDKPDGPTLTAGLEALKKEDEPTMVVIPDAVLLDAENCATLQKAVLMHCGYEMRSRFAILDVHRGFLERGSVDPVADFRGSLGVNHLDFGAAYYPWVETTIVQDSSLGFHNLDAGARGVLEELLEEEGRIPKELREMLTEDGLDKDKVPMLNKALVNQSLVFKSLLSQIKADSNRLPPSGAIAGIYTLVDNTRGVWKAPANVSLNGVIRPSVSISHEEQEDLNVTPQGKSVNAIRTFIGEGTLVWGGRTLDGNSLDWRYISVRRTMVMVEQSIKLAAKAYVFEANDANTWVTLKSMIRNFLTGIWKRGGLAGSTPDDAFAIFVGLGETMTGEDILEGILKVTVLVAVTRPAEFIEITFQQQMQKS